MLDHLPTDGDVFDSKQHRLIIATDLLDPLQLACQTEEVIITDKTENLQLNHSRIVQLNQTPSSPNLIDPYDEIGDFTDNHFMRESGQSRFFLEGEKPIKIKIRNDQLVVKDRIQHSPKKRISARSSVLPIMNISPRNVNRKTRKMLGIKNSSGNKSPPPPVNRVSTLGIREFGEQSQTPHRSRSRSGSYNDGHHKQSNIDYKHYDMKQSIHDSHKPSHKNSDIDQYIQKRKNIVKKFNIKEIIQKEMQKTNTEELKELMTTNGRSPHNLTNQQSRASQENYGYNSSMSGWNAHITFNKFDHGILEKSQISEEKSAEFQIEKEHIPQHPQTTKNQDSLKFRLNLNVETNNSKEMDVQQLVLPYLNFINSNNGNKNRYGSVQKQQQTHVILPSVLTENSTHEQTFDANRQRAKLAQVSQRIPLQYQGTHLRNQSVDRINDRPFQQWNPSNFGAFPARKKFLRKLVRNDENLSSGESQDDTYSMEMINEIKALHQEQMKDPKIVMGQKIGLSTKNLIQKQFRGKLRKNQQSSGQQTIVENEQKNLHKIQLDLSPQMPSSKRILGSQQNIYSSQQYQNAIAAIHDSRRQIQIDQVTVPTEIDASLQHDCSNTQLQETRSYIDSEKHYNSPKNIMNVNSQINLINSQVIGVSDQIQTLKSLQKLKKESHKSLNNNLKVQTNLSVIQGKLNRDDSNIVLKKKNRFKNLDLLHFQELGETFDSPKLHKRKQIHNHIKSRFYIKKEKALPHTTKNRSPYIMETNLGSSSKQPSIQQEELKNQYTFINSFIPRNRDLEQSLSKSVIPSNQQLHKYLKKMDIKKVDESIQKLEEQDQKLNEWNSSYHDLMYIRSKDQLSLGQDSASTNQKKWRNHTQTNQKQVTNFVKIRENKPHVNNCEYFNNTQSFGSEEFQKLMEDDPFKFMQSTEGLIEDDIVNIRLDESHHHDNSNDGPSVGFQSTFRKSQMLRDPSIEINYHDGHRKKILVSPTNSQKSRRKRIKKLQKGLANRTGTFEINDGLNEQSSHYLGSNQQSHDRKHSYSKQESNMNRKRFGSKDFNVYSLLNSHDKNLTFHKQQNLDLYVDTQLNFMAENNTVLQSPVTEEPYTTHNVTPCQVRETHGVKIDANPNFSSYLVDPDQNIRFDDPLASPQDTKDLAEHGGTSISHQPSSIRIETKAISIFNDFSGKKISEITTPPHNPIESPPKQKNPFQRPIKRLKNDWAVRSSDHLTKDGHYIADLNMRSQRSLNTIKSYTGMRAIQMNKQQKQLYEQKIRRDLDNIRVNRIREKHESQLKETVRIMNLSSTDKSVLTKQSLQSPDRASTTRYNSPPFALLGSPHQTIYKNQYKYVLNFIKKSQIRKAKQHEGKILEQISEGSHGEDPNQYYTENPSPVNDATPGDNFQISINKLPMQEEKTTPKNSERDKERSQRDSLPDAQSPLKTHKYAKQTASKKTSSKLSLRNSNLSLHKQEDYGNKNNSSSRSGIIEMEMKIIKPVRKSPKQIEIDDIVDQKLVLPKSQSYMSYNFKRSEYSQDSSEQVLQLWQKDKWRRSAENLHLPQTQYPFIAGNLNFGSRQNLSVNDLKYKYQSSVNVGPTIQEEQIITQQDLVKQVVK